MNTKSAFLIVSFMNVLSLIIVGESNMSRIDDTNIQKTMIALNIEFWFN